MASKRPSELTLMLLIYLLEIQLQKDITQPMIFFAFQLMLSPSWRYLWWNSTSLKVCSKFKHYPKMSWQLMTNTRVIHPILAWKTSLNHEDGFIKSEPTFWLTAFVTMFMFTMLALFSKSAPKEKNCEPKWRGRGYTRRERSRRRKMIGFRPINQPRFTPTS